MKLPRWLPQGRLPVPSWGSVSVFCGLALLVQFYIVFKYGESLLTLSQPSWVLDYFGLTRDGIISGKIWQVLSYSLVHGSWLHLLGNLFIIYVTGERLRKIVGEKAVLITMIGGVMLGALGYVLLQPVDIAGLGLTQEMAPLVGASPAMFALLLVMTGLSPDSKMWPIPVSGKNLGRGLLISSLLLFLMTPGLGLPIFSNLGLVMARFSGMEIFQIGHVTHFGGALFGCLMARKLLGPKITLEHLKKARQKREGH